MTVDDRDDAGTATVLAVHLDARRGVSKGPRERIRLLAGHGGEADVHAGAT